MQNTKIWIFAPPPIIELAAPLVLLHRFDVVYYERKVSRTLQTLLSIGHAFEQSERQAAKIENSFDSSTYLNAVSSRFPQDDRKREGKEPSVVSL